MTATPCVDNWYYLTWGKWWLSSILCILWEDYHSNNSPHSLLELSVLVYSDSFWMTFAYDLHIWLPEAIPQCSYEEIWMDLLFIEGQVPKSHRLGCTSLNSLNLYVWCATWSISWHEMIVTAWPVTVTPEISILTCIPDMLIHSIWEFSEVNWICDNVTVTQNNTSDREKNQLHAGLFCDGIGLVFMEL